MSVFRHVAITSTLLLALPVSGAHARAPVLQDVKPVPPPGIAVPETDRAELTRGVQELGAEIGSLRTDLRRTPELLRFLPDIQIFHNAVRYALEYNEFYNVKEMARAKEFLVQGKERANELRAGTHSWTQKSGLVTLGYVSKIDGSVQPYGLVVPPTWSTGDKTLRRLDLFCHGRGETLTELNFIAERQRSAGEFTPPDTFVLHPYGRYCNASRYAGEIDLFEALADAKTRYPIDDDCVVMRGFSMGGASAWQFATHHPGMWVAAAPGAGFVEAAEYLRLNAPEKPPIPWYERKLWHWYNATDYAANLFNCPVIAYNGENDKQKQAADKMEEAMAKESLALTRVTGKNVGHQYTPEAKQEINDRIDSFVDRKRNTLPEKIRFTTWTLRYNTVHWLTLTGLNKHWEQARIDADRSGKNVVVTTQNVSRFSLAPEATAQKRVVIDGQTLTGNRFAKSAAGKWSTEKASDEKRLRKSPGLQGPIDDAFMDRFVMVRPTGRPIQPRLGEWVMAEMNRAVKQWRAMFRGDALIKDDTAVTEADMTAGNIVLWGDPSSNSVLARIADRLPIRWEKDGTVRVGKKSYPAGTSVPVLVYPNPLNPRHYVVINSGITWREGHYYSNAAQYPRLPDWAVVDITVPPTKVAPGRIADAGFFDEGWHL